MRISVPGSPSTPAWARGVPSGLVVTSAGTWFPLNHQIKRSACPYQFGAHQLPHAQQLFGELPDALLAVAEVSSSSFHKSIAADPDERMLRAGAVAVPYESATLRDTGLAA